jgi:hypothetical protein
VKEDQVLEREEEAFTFAKDYLAFKIDKETMEGTLTLTIVPEKDVLELGMFLACREFDDDEDDLVAKLTGKDLMDEEETPPGVQEEAVEVVTGGGTG